MTATTSSAVSLHQLRRGERGRVSVERLDPADAALLRAMGLRDNTVVRVCRAGHPCIVEICPDPACNPVSATRIGLARDLAARVTVSADPR